MNVLSDFEVLESHFFDELRGVGLNEVNVVISEEYSGNGAVLPDDSGLLSVEEFRNGESVHGGKFKFINKVVKKECQRIIEKYN